jgi:hypothetical protein
VKIVTKPATNDATPLGVLKHVCASRGINYSSGRYMCANGLPHIRIGRAIYVKFSDFDDWIATRTNRAS